ncbi:hypothetical protein BH10PSE17_BH10PSE17_30440 [soil metagenome]
MSEAQQRDAQTRVRETHHRTKNDLQGIAALLRYTTPADPAAALAIVDAVARIQAIAIVHGLQMGDDDQLVPLVDLLNGIAANAAQTLQVDEPRIEPASFIELPHIRAQDAVAIALAGNELSTYALRTCTGAAGVAGRWSMAGSSVRFALVFAASLPAGFTLDSVSRSMQGLGLAKSLLPRNGTRLELMPERERVVLQLSVDAPVLVGISA